MDKFTYSGLSCFSERPSSNTRYLINRQLPKLIDIAINDTLEFVNTAQTKERALKQLKYVVLIGEKEVQGHLQKIMRALVKIWQSDIQEGQKTIQQIVVVIGYHLSSDFYLPLVLNMLGAQDFRTSPKNTVILLKLIAYMLQKTEDIAAHIPELAKLISVYQAQFIDNDDGLITVSQIAINLIRRLPSLEQANLVSTLFSVLLNVQATKTLPVAHHQETEEAMKMLATKSGFASVAELHSREVGPTLQNLVQKKQYTKWVKTSKERFKFDAIVRNCQGEAVNFLSDILTVMEYCITLECDIQIRMDTLVLLQAMLAQQSVKEALKPHAVRVMIKLLNTAIKWKVGKPQIKIRKAGIINMIRMIQQEVINAEQLIQCFDQILPQIKGCITDDWAPQLRLACCQFLEHFLMTAKDVVDGEHLRELYVILLERLDDSQDPIRKKTTTAINLFFLAKYLPVTASVSSILEYMITAIFVHYDDSNPEIRDAINVSLRYAARVDPSQVLKQAKANVGRMKHKEQCEQLVEFCKEQIEEKKI